MKIISLIYTQKIKHRVIGDFLIKECNLFYCKKCKSERFLENRHSDISIKVNKFNVEIMYRDAVIEEVINIIQKLTQLNNNQKLSIKSYNNEERNNIMRFNKMQEFYFV